LSRALGFFAVSWLLVAAALAPGASASTLPSGFQDGAVISGLNTPTSVRFSPDGRVFVAEKSGLIKVYSSLSDPTPTTFADLRTQVYDYWDRGLLGLALDPDFPQQPYVYALYSHDAPIGGTAPVWNDQCPDPPGANSDGCVGSGRLVRLTASGDVATGPPQVLIEDWCIQFTTHSVGDLVFGPDGALYVSGGDGAGWLAPDYGQSGIPKNPCGDPPAKSGGTETPPTAEGGALRSQDLRTSGDPTGLDGSIVRVDPDTGAALPTNPLAASSDANARRIVAYGFRNPFRFAFRPGTSEIWLGDVGMDDWEEIDRLQDPLSAPVENFGWPCYEGTGHQPGYDNADLNLCESLYNLPADQPDAARAPYFTYPHSGKVVNGESCPSGGSSISGMTFYPGGSYPDSYDGALFFADYSRACIWAMPTNGGALPDPGARLTFDAGAPGPVDLELGPGGDLYYASLNGEIRRITYTPGNQAPVADAQADPTSGPAPLSVDFDARGSSDPERDPISFAWDLDGDGQFDDSTSATPSATYAAGTHTASVKVTDSHDASSTASVTVVSGDTPPTATIDSPSSSLSWKVGDRIQFSGSGQDDHDGALGPSRFSWTIDIHHCPSNCHVHHLQSTNGAKSGEFFAPDHEYPTFLTLQLTVTDSAGLSDSDEVRLDPRTAQLRIDSTPSGLRLGVDNEVAPAPLAKTVVMGSRHLLSAPATQSAGGRSYSLSGWSDGGAASHEVVVNSDTTLSASYIGGAAASAFDLSPLGTRIRRGPRHRIHDDTPRFRFKSVPPGGASGFSCRVDAGNWFACSSPLTLQRLAPGPHIFRVRSVDPRGRVDPSPAKRHFRVLAG
jgi:glucose/arabinose dehydrogenase